jgi:CRISPR/Cas system-associated exonuclease Cas4 (RecB family)
LNKLLVFPTSRAIRNYISINQEINTLLPKIISIDELFKNSININKKKYIDENLRIIYLKEAVDFIEFNQLGISTKSHEFFRQSDFIFRFLGELSHENIEIDSLDQYDTYAHYTEHIEILKIVKQNYINILNKHNLVDKLNLPDNYSINTEYIQSFDTIHIVLEGYLSKFEYLIIDQISSHNTTTVQFDYNKLNEKSILQINNNTLNLQLNNKYTINLSTNEILEVNKIEEIKSPAKIFPFESRINQIAFIKQSIYDLIMIEKINPEDIVIILPDETFASQLKLFDKENYFNFAFGFDIKDTASYKTINAISTFMNDRQTQHQKLLEFVEIENEFFLKIEQNWNKNISHNILETIREFIENNNDTNEVKQSIQKILFTLTHVFFDNNVKIELKDFFKILIQKLNKLTIDDTRGGKITVMGLLETRSVNFKGVIVCDFNDDIVPKRSSKDKFLSSHIKELASLPTATNRQNLQAYYYDKLFKQASHIYISYVQNDISNISRFAIQLLDYKHTKTTCDKIFENILYTQNKIQTLDDDIILDIDLSKKIWSATSLKRFLECKRKYYLQDILKIKEHHFSIKPQGFELGQIIHNTLEDIYKKNNYFSNEEILYKNIINKLTSFEINNPYLIFDIELWKKKIQKLVKTDIKRFNQGIKILECEKTFKIIHNGVTLTGSIDRIDIHQDASIDILDYKTSKSLKIDTLKTYEKAKDFQLEFYYLANQSDKILKVCYYDLNSGQLLDEQMLDEKLVLLDEKLSELTTNSVNFSKCDDLKECQYCPYTTICQRD